MEKCSEGFFSLASSRIHTNVCMKKSLQGDMMQKMEIVNVP
jgi:hypothetical protein